MRCVVFTDLWELWVRFVDGMGCCIDSMSKFLLQQPIGLCSLTYPVIGHSICQKINMMIYFYSLQVNKVIEL